MKWSQYGRITLALVASLALGLSITACNPSFTLGFVYVLNSKNNPGTISAYSIDSVSGAITQVANSPFSLGQQYPIAAAVSNNSKWLYVLNEVDNTLVQFTIGTDGKLYKANTYDTPGTYPIAMAIDPTSGYLFVVDSYAPGFNGVAPPNINPLQTNSTPTQGCVAVFPINASDGTLTAPATCTPVGTPQIGAQPIGVTATAFVHYLYVADQGMHTVYAYSVDYAHGAALTPLNQTGYAAGVKPSAIVSDPSGRFVYVTDQYQNVILGYNIQADGSLVSQVNGPFSTDLFPYAMVIDPRGKFLYVANLNGNDVYAYAINPSTGNPSRLTGGTYATGSEPNCLTIEPAYGRYVYISSFIDNTISGYKLDPATGVLKTVLNSPFPTGGQPTCVVAAANGAHPVQSITP